jgi:hypothetical protein
MIRLNPTKDTQTIDLGFGVEVTVRPLTSAIFADARVDPDVPKLRADSDDGSGIGESKEVVTVALVKAIARRTITAWDGIGDPDGNPVDPSPAWIGLLLDQWALYEAFNAKFVGKFLLLRDEGNGFAPLPNGTSGGAQAIATDATNNAPTAPES